MGLIGSLDLVLDASLIAIISAVIIGGFLRGFVGFGAALVIVPVLTLTMGPHLAVAVASIVGLPAIVQLLPGKDGLVHSAQISRERVENVADKLKEGEMVKVKVLEVDKQGRIRLSMKALEEEPVS